MAQKKKAPVSPKSAARNAVGKSKSMPLKVGASANKVAKHPIKPKVEAAAPAAKAKVAHPAPAAKPVKKPVPVAVKPAATKIEAAPAAKKPLTHAPAAAHLAAKAAPAPQRTVAVPANAHKAASQKLTAPVAAAQQPAVTPKAIAEKAAATRQILAVQKKPVSQRHGFKANEFIVYPAHGVGRIVGIEEQEIAGMSLELFVITFDKEKLTLRVPTGKLASVGMRKLADEGLVKKAMETLKGRARIKRTMWSRRAQEYVAKINSGDLISIAEVVRDLYRSEAQPEQSYSERQLYEDALDRMARELAAVEKLDERGAVQRITEILSKSAKGRRLAESESSVGEAA
jgi:CarD family transcriptional regulator, regulator of rRNA transcription